MRAAVWAARVTGLVLCGVSACAAASAEKPLPPPQPAVRIPVAPLGYLPPSDFYLTYRLSSESMGFLDDDHLLFTFRIGGLLRRLPTDRDGDDDQQIRAVVLDLRTGRPIRQTEWRMHDRSQYLWPLEDGRFLVRVRNALYLTDESLQLKPYLSFDTALRVVQISPDRSMMLVEHSAPPRPAAPRSSAPSLLAPQTGQGTGQDAGQDAAQEETPGQPVPVQVEVLPAGSRAAVVSSDAHTALSLPLMHDGFLDVLPSRERADWAVRVVPFHGEPRILADMKSNCDPSVQPVSRAAALILGCYAAEGPRPVVAISTVDGHELWQDQWDSKYVWGWFDYAENGSRFVYESLQVDRPISIYDALDPSDIAAQLAGVYDTETGRLVLVTDAAPVLTAGQNVALSPDGRRFAVLRDGAVEVYDLPPVQPAEAKNAGGKK